MVTRESVPPPADHHMVRDCKKHGPQHYYLHIDDASFCLQCLSALLNVKIGQLGPETICLGPKV